jgi:peptide/nickel transport system permease protein
MAMPMVVLAFLMLYLFAFRFPIFPPRGSMDVMAVGTGWFNETMSRLHHLILPGLTGAIFGSAGIVQYLRAQIVDVRNSDYVLTARSKGVPENVIYNKHVLKNSLLPIVSGIGFAITGLLGGSVFIERIFSYPGMGNFFITSVESRDFSIVNFLVLFYGALGVIGALISDIAITVFDPRIRIK